MANKPVTLSKGQLDVLKGMWEDNILLDKQGRTAYLAGTGDVNLLTFHALKNKGYIEFASSDERVAEWRITRAGIEAVDEQEKGSSLA